MRLIDIATEAAAHRATVVTLLRSYLPYGRRGPAARAVGVSPSYLSRVLSDQPYGGLARLEPLGQDLAARLTDWLGLDARSRDRLLEHAHLSHESHVKACIEMEAVLSRRELDMSLPELLKLHAAAGRELNPALASNLYTRSYCMAKQLVESVPPRDYPLEFAQVCLVLNDLEAVLDHNVDGIYSVKIRQVPLFSPSKPQFYLLGQKWLKPLIRTTSIIGRK
jgi:transcriptional regulator with XRE-family HTH domain